MSDDLTRLDLPQTFDRMAVALRAYGPLDLLVGVHTGGVWVARALRARLDGPPELAELDVSFHRDDYERSGVRSGVQASNLTAEVEDRHIVLVDDVFYTGRTVRAALNELFDYGRPARVILAVLVDRGGRELPIRPDVTGCRARLGARRRVKLEGPEPLRLVVSAAPGVGRSRG